MSHLSMPTECCAAIAMYVAVPVTLQVALPYSMEDPSRYCNENTRLPHNRIPRK
jgi:hypothetical protein